MYLYDLHSLSGYSAFSIISFYLFLLKAKHERGESMVQYWTSETSVKTSVMSQASWLTLGRSLWIGGSFAIERYYDLVAVL